jgi:hypothetical protein
MLASVEKRIPRTFPERNRDICVSLMPIRDASSRAVMLRRLRTASSVTMIGMS